MKQKFRKHEDIGILKVSGRLDATNAWELKDKFAEYLTETNKFVLDLEGLDSLDSAGLSEIVSCLKAASEVGGDVKIVSLQDKPRLLFETSRADRIFDMYNELIPAIESFELVTAE